MRIGFLITTLAVVCFGGACTANDNMMSNPNVTQNANMAPQSTPARGIMPQHDDKEFANKVANDGMAEVELAKLAEQKTSNSAVKSFAQRMITDHSKANEELKNLAAEKNISLPSDINEEQKADKERLSKLKGSEFDKEYMSLMVNAHDKAVSAFQDESDHGSDADLKAWATTVLPTLKEHQTMAKDINAKLQS